MPKTYNHISYEEREKIEEMYNAGMRPVDIAKELGRSQTTIYKEINRGIINDENGRVKYSAQKANNEAPGGWKNELKVDAHKKCARLTVDDKIRIQKMLNDGYSLTKIAYILNRDLGSLSKEVKKHTVPNENGGIVYDPFAYINLRTAINRFGAFRGNRMEYGKRERRGVSFTQRVVNAEVFGDE